MTRRDRLRRVVILCAHFARNLAYYRAGHQRLDNTSPQFWITVDGNFIDMAVLEWCKLFGDRKAHHSWSDVVIDAHRFEGDLFRHLGVNADQFSAYVNEMRTIRDKFLAHLDDLSIMHIPLLDRARSAVDFYHRHIVQNEAAAADLVGLPTDLDDYYDRSFKEASAIYGHRGFQIR